MTSELYPSRPILVVDDEEQTLNSCKIVLKTSGISNVKIQNDSRQVLPILLNEDIGVLLLDLSMPHVSGEELLQRIKTEFTDIPIIIITGANDIDTAVTCMRQGAFDYIVKPVDKNRLVSSVQRAIEFRELQWENTKLKRHILDDSLENPEAFEGILTQSKVIRSIFKYVESIAATTQPVLITGETGVGKELMAKAIHRLSGRKGSFVPINVAGLDDTVFSDTLFGHKRGAFTGAANSRKGLVESAVHGTLFLDEIGDLHMMSQVKLLRLLQEREYYPLGADVPRRADARIVCATNQDLTALIQEGRFRKDLYFRLQTHHVRMPPLRERKDDLPLLTDFFLERAANALGKKIPTPPKELYALLKTYHFPGNIRELESMVFDAVSKHESRMLSLEVFKTRIFKETGGSDEELRKLQEEDEPRVVFADRLPTLRELSQLLVEEALGRADNNQSIAAKMLGISQQALSKRLKNNQSD